jgi:hypothetical protein
MNVIGIAGHGCSAPTRLPEAYQIETGYVQARSGFAGQSLRADGALPSADLAVEALRLRVRDYVEAEARACQHRRRLDTGRDEPVPQARRALLARTLCAALGIQARDGVMRSDSYFVPGDLTAPAGAPVKARMMPLGIQQSLRVRAVPASSRRVPTNYVGYSGTANVMTPGLTQFPRADVSVQQKEIQVSWLVTSTQIDWMDEMYAAEASAISVMAEKAEAARRSLAYALEAILVNGLAGLDWMGLGDLPAAGYQSSLDYADAATTLDDIHEDIVKMSQVAQSANAFRGTQPDTLLAGPRFFQQLARRSNYDAGGFLEGAGQFGTVAMIAGGGPQAVVGKLFQNLGVNNVVIAPQLQNFRGTGRDGLIWYNAGNDQGLRQVVAQLAAPVRTHTDATTGRARWCGWSTGRTRRSTSAARGATCRASCSSPERPRSTRRRGSRCARTSPR